MSEDVREQVREAMIEPAESAPAETIEEVTSDEVKPIETVVVDTPESSKGEERPAAKESKEDVVVDKSKEQLENLNKALSIEREEKKKLREEFEETKSLMEKMKNVFTPEREVVETPEEKTEQEKFEEWYAAKESEKEQNNKTMELQKKIETEIDTLSKEWDGKEGKPKYDDAEVYKWQSDNSKKHLMPEEAFFLMKRDDILDWKAKQVISKASSGISSEKPSGSGTEHNPEKTTPKNEQELRNAVLEAISSSE